MPPRKSKSAQPPHLSVVATATQLRNWTRAAKHGQTTLSAWVRFTLDDAADDALLDSRGKSLTNEELRGHVDRFTRRMKVLLEKRGSGRR